MVQLDPEPEVRAPQTGDRDDNLPDVRRPEPSSRGLPRHPWET